MKRYIHIFTVILIFSCTNADAQRIPRRITDEGNAYPLVTLNTMIGMYHMTVADYDRNMKLITKVRDVYDDGSITYTVSNKTGTNDGWCFVTKKKDAIEIAYNFGPNKKSIMADLMMELKDYYVKDIEGNKIYSYKYFEDPHYVNFIFVVTTNAESEYVKMNAEPVN